MTQIEFSHKLVSLRNNLEYYANMLTSNREEAKDLLQDTFLKALSNRDKFASDTNLKAWTYTIMKNTFINDHRRAKRTKALMDTVDRERDQVRRVQTPASAEASVKMSEISRSLERLDPAFRTPFTMHHEGYKYHEIADHMGIPIGTVKSRIFQARQRLMEMLSDKHINN